MSGWTVPFSSSPQAPSTPGSGERSKSSFAKLPNGTAKSPLLPNPSTTPAGPPPSSVASFTPADPPPSSIFASSQLGSGKTLFKSKISQSTTTSSRKGVKPSYSTTIDQRKLARFLNKSEDFNLGSSDEDLPKNSFGTTSSISSQGPSSDDEEEEEEASFEDEPEEFDEDADADADAEGSEEEGTMDADPILKSSAISSTSKRPSVNGPSVAFGSSIMETLPRGTKRSRGGSKIFNYQLRSADSKYESANPSIVKSMATHLGIAKLQETDEFILGTEDIIKRNLYDTKAASDRHESISYAGLHKASEKLSHFWRSWCDQDLAKLPPEQEVLKGIGPDAALPPVHKATFLGGLLLQLRHPPTARGKQALAVASLRRSSVRPNFPPIDHTPTNPTAFPKVLSDWLNHSHDPYGPFNIDVYKFQPNPTAHFNYWDVLFSSTLRGKLFDVISLLKGSNFHFAKTAKDDRKDGNGYSSVQVRNIERVINRAIQVLEHSPTLQDENWNITGNQWIMFRKRIEQALADLTTFANGPDRKTDIVETSFEAANFGLKSTTMDLSQSARRAESQVPWTIYQSLKTIYGILLGDTTAILAMAQDWVEATVGLTVWWVGDDDEEVAVGSVALTRQSLRQSKSFGPRLVDVNPNAAYLRRLSVALERVEVESSKEKGLAINTLNPVELGLASLFEGNVAGVMGLLRAWSLPVISAIAEIAGPGGWLETGNEMGILHGLDESDLMVLDGYKQPERLTEQPVTKDAILMKYADALSQKSNIVDQTGKVAHEGWELSISILTRLDDETTARKRVGELLLRLDRDSTMRVDTILRTCKQFGIIKEAKIIAEEFADNAIEGSNQYGTALIYYARAGCQKKVKGVLDLLISLSLVHSAAYPALTALDSDLYQLISEPHQTLRAISLLEPKAAAMLKVHLSGYATLRRFYDLRDEEIQSGEGPRPGTRPIARKSAAATAIVAVINSAADSIHGGLFDESRGAVMQVDGLLALVGEATMFVNQASFLLSLPQCFALLKAIEDLQTVTSRIYSRCEECFRSTLAAYRGEAAPPSPRKLLKKTMSSVSSSFSVIGESMVQSGSDGMRDSKALIGSKDKGKRGWDWRTGLDENATGEDVLRILRIGLAKDIAKHWMAGEGS